MFEHCLYFNTSSLARRLDRLWTEAFKPFGLTPAQGFMLRVVLEMAPLSPSALAGELNISKATCSRGLDGLEAAGFVGRVQTGLDGRSHDLVPTAKARAIKEALNQASGEVTKRLKRQVGADCFEGTVASLRKIGQTLE